MRPSAISLALVGALLLASSATAAEVKEVEPIKVGEESVQKLVLTGPIAPGDAGRLDKLISEEPYTILSLDSEGGDYREGLAIAKLLSDSMVMTVVEDGASCLAACAIAFLGGNGDTDDSGDYAPARSIAPTARLGFAAPPLELGDKPTKADVDNAYAHVLTTISGFVGSSSDMYVEGEAIAEILKPRSGDPYLVNNAYRLAHIGVEVQGLAAPKVLTASMARNLCQTGWEPTEGKPDGKAGQAIARLKWKPADTTFVAKSDHFGSGLPVKRTLIPFGFMDDDPDDGYTFCLVDQTMDAGKLKVACRGFVYGNDLPAGMERARHFDGDPDAGESGEADIACEIPDLIEPLTPIGASSPDNRWALVPGDTPLGKIGDVLAGYAAKEPPL